MSVKKQILLCYVVRDGLGLNNKVTTLISGFEAKGYAVNRIIFEADNRGFRGLLHWLHVHFLFLKNAALRNHDIVFVRYSYQFLPIFLASRLLRLNLHLELNSDHRQEFILQNQIYRGKVDAAAFRIALGSATCAHVVSQELINRFKLVFPSARFVYNPNYVVDAYFSGSREKQHAGLINLVFLGDTTQKWQGIDKFVERIIAPCNWARKHVSLNIVGRVSPELERVIAKHRLQDTVVYHGILRGAEKAELIKKMDVGIGVFDLGAKGMSETTSIKVGEYLYAGLAIIIGYTDLSIPKKCTFALAIDVESDDCVEAVIEFVKFVRANPEIHAAAHEYAEKNLMVSNYISKILDSAGLPS